MGEIYVLESKLVSWTKPDIIIKNILPSKHLESPQL